MVRPKPKTLTSKHATGREKVLLRARNGEQDHAHMRWWSGWVDGESGRGTDGHITTRDIDVGQCKAHQQQHSGPLSLFVGHKWPIFSISSPNLASDTIEAFPLKVLLLFLSVDFLLLSGPEAYVSMTALATFSKHVTCGNLNPVTIQDLVHVSI